jgi:outer membrane protein OmpA-like peptidoglycan-associated protein
MDRQAQEMNADLSDATVERVGQRIKVTFGSGVLFAPGSADLTADARTSVNRLAVILKKYPDTNVNIEGHTDSDGAEAANQALSERRASAVAAALSDSGVGAARLHPAGYGETQPVATNGTPEGKAANRRVEIIVIAGERLRADMAP